MRFFCKFNILNIKHLFYKVSAFIPSISYFRLKICYPGLVKLTADSIFVFAFC